MNPTFPDGVAAFATEEDTIRAIRSALGVWEDVRTSAVKFRYRGTTDKRDAFDGVNVVTFQPSFPLPAGFDGGIFPLAWYAEAPGPVATPAGTTLPADLPAQTVDCDLVINPRGRFAITDGPLPKGVFSFEGVLVHEVGHMLGLDHSGLGQTTMYAYATWGHGAYASKLSMDDKLGVSALYPAPGLLDRYATIRGTVTTTTGAPIAGAHVVAIDSATGSAIASTVSGVSALRDGLPDRYSLRSGDFVLLVPPGRYLLLVEPFGQPDQGNPYLSGIFGSASAGETYTFRDFQPLLRSETVEVAAGEAVEIAVSEMAASSPEAPIVGRRSSWMREEGASEWVDPARLVRGRRATVSIAAGRNIVRDGELVPGAEFRLLGPGVSVQSGAPGPGGRTVELKLSVSSDAPPGSRVLEVATPTGRSYFPGAMAVCPEGSAG